MVDSRGSVCAMPRPGTDHVMERGSRRAAPRARERLGNAWLIAAVVVAAVVLIGFALRFVV